MFHTDQAGRHYLDDRNFAHASFDDYTSMAGMQIDGRVDARCIDVDGGLSWTNLYVADRMYAWHLSADNLDLSRSRFKDDLYLRSASVPYNLTARETSIAGEADVSYAELGAALFEDARIEEGLSYRGTKFEDELVLRQVDTPFIDLRGITLPKLYADDLDRYTLRVDDDTWIGEVTETGTADVELTEKERTWYEDILDRPQIPPDRRDGCVFTVDDLRRDFVITSAPDRRGLLGSLTQKGGFKRVDDEYYIARSDL